MKAPFLAAGIAALALTASGCATAPVAAAPTAAAPAAPVEAAPQRSGYGAVIARAGRADAPRLAQVMEMLGAADIDNREGAGAMLTYRAESCALVLIFASGTLAEAQSLPREAGGQAASLDDCVEAVYARSRR